MLTSRRPCNDRPNLVALYWTKLDHLRLDCYRPVDFRNSPDGPGKPGQISTVCKPGVPWRRLELLREEDLEQVRGKHPQQRWLPWKDDHLEEYEEDAVVA